MLNTFIASQTDLNGTLPTELGNLLELSKPTDHFESESFWIQFTICCLLTTKKTFLCNWRVCYLPGDFRIQNTKISGTLPTELARLPHLQRILLDGSDMTGVIHEDICNLQDLIIICTERDMTELPATEPPKGGTIADSNTIRCDCGNDVCKC